MSIRGGYNTPQGDFDYEPPEDPLALELQQLKITHEDLQKEHETLNASHAEVCATLEAAQARVAELEALSAKQMYFASDENGWVEFYESADSAKAAAEGSLQSCRECSEDGWNQDEVEKIAWGVVVEQATLTEVMTRPDDEDEEAASNFDWDSFDEMWDFGLRPPGWVMPKTAVQP